MDYTPVAVITGEQATAASEALRERLEQNVQALLEQLAGSTLDLADAKDTAQLVRDDIDALAGLWPADLDPKGGR